MIWLGLDPQDTKLIDSHQREIADCMNMLNDAAQRGEIRHYDKKVVKTIAHPGVDEPIKIFQYTFSLQSLIDFAKIRNHKLVLVDGKARSDTPIGAEKPLSTTERNTLLTIIAALCNYSVINYQERGAASQITKLTEELGAPVSHDSVRRALEEIPDALQTRMK